MTNLQIDIGVLPALQHGARARSAPFLFAMLALSASMLEACDDGGTQAVTTDSSVAPSAASGLIDRTSSVTSAAPVSSVESPATPAATTATAAPSPAPVVVALATPSTSKPQATVVLTSTDTPPATPTMAPPATPVTPVPTAAPKAAPPAVVVPIPKAAVTVVQAPAPTTQTLQLQIVIPGSSAAVVPASYVSPGTKSLRVSVNGASSVLTPVGAGVAGCSTAASGSTCLIVITVPTSTSFTVQAYGYANASGSGAPLEVGVQTISAGATTVLLVTPAWKPVVAALTTSLGGRFAAGVPSSIPVTVVAADAAGFTIPAGSAGWLDASGAAVSIGLTDSDTSASTALATTTYAGAPVALNYDGNLPLPNPIKITAATSGSTPIASAPTAVVQPTASRSFTFSLGGTVTVVQNTTGIPTNDHNVDWWNAIPDSKIAIVNLGQQYLISWGNGAWADISNSPYPEDAQGSSFRMYTPSTPQNFEQAGWWFRDVLPLNNPFHPTDTQNLVSFYHAESDYTGPHTKTVGVSYSHDGGKTWSTGAQILTPNAYTSGIGISSADEGAIYDPVNKRWVIFFTAIDPSANISGHLSEAISNDPNGAPGTWYKLYEGAFTQPGLQGQETTLTAVQNQGYISSPTISWNSYLNEWVMIADWGGVGEALMTSPDLYTWSTPVKLMDGTNLGYSGASSAYPTLVGDHDDKITGQTSRLYFAEMSSVDSRIYGRLMLEQELTFQRND